jgi:hypothetical protein
MLVGAIVLGWLCRGSLGRLADMPLRRRSLVGAAVAAQVAGALLAGALGSPIYLAGLATSAACAAAFCGLNLRRAGVPLAAFGLAANAVVVGLNVAMPVSPYAAARAGIATGPIAAGVDARHTLAGPGTHLAVLGDVVPVPWPIAPEVISFGDGLLAAGLALFIFTGMRSRRAEGDLAAPRTDGASTRRADHNGRLAHL